MMVANRTEGFDAGYQAEHLPVFPKETLCYLQPRRGGVYMDCTIGEGGHACAILEASGDDTTLVGIDRDNEILKVAEKRLKRFAGRYRLVHDNFSNLKAILKSLNIDRVAGIFFDLGISSYHLSRPERGFSFQLDGPLDMRMDRTERTTASDLVNGLSEKRLADILWEYGQERWSRRIARRIVWTRADKAINPTSELADIVRRAVAGRYGRGKIHPSTKTFQAIRIELNDELNILPDVVRDAIEILQTGGRACFISFHSLEDRMIKHTLKLLERGGADPFKSEIGDKEKGGKVLILTPKPITPSLEERTANPRSRSAKLRVAEKII